MIRELALLGIDGVGKSTIAVALKSRLESEGVNADITSWSSSSRKHPSDFERRCLGDLLFAAFRGMYAGAQTKEGPARALFPPSAEEFLTSETIRDSFLDLQIVDNETWGIVGGAIAEMSGNFLFRYLDVLPRLEKGHLVIQETFGHKHLVKDLYLARTLAKRNGDLHFIDLIDRLEELSEWLFTNTLAPQIGFVIDGDPAPAIARRMEQTGRAGWTENMQLAGESTAESFLHMQQYARAKFLAFGERHGWHVITIHNEGKEKDTARAVDLIVERLKAA